MPRSTPGKGCCCDDILSVGVCFDVYLDLVVYLAVADHDFYLVADAAVSSKNETGGSDTACAG